MGKYQKWVKWGFFLSLALLVILGIVFELKISRIDNASPNSMYPTYDQNDMVIVIRVSNSSIRVGDVVLLNSSGNSEFVLHRVIDIVEINKATYIRTKGDNYILNEMPDVGVEYIGSLISLDHVIGKVILSIKSLGSVLDFAGNILLLPTLLALVFHLVYVQKRKGTLINLDELKARRKTIFMTFSTLLLLILLVNNIPIRSGFIEISGIDVSNPVLVTETFEGEDLSYYYYQLSIHINSTETYEKIDRVEAHVYETDSKDNLISKHRWNPAFEIMGNYTIGLGVVIMLSDVDIEGHILYLELILYTRLFREFSTVYASFLPYPND